jgi:HK97 family phage prohead protease
LKAERRFIKAEVRATDGDSPHIVGHAAVFNSRSQDLGGFFEIIAPGAFDACLASAPDIVGMWNHDDTQIPLGRTSSGTMKVSVDSIGVQYDIDPPNTTIARDLMVSLRRKDVNASSFGFFCLQDEWSIDPETDSLLRTVQKADIFDCSPVIFPAFLAAESSLRAAFAGAPEHRSLGMADAEIRNKVASIRQQLMQGDGDALAGAEWQLRALQLLHTAERRS